MNNCFYHPTVTKTPTGLYKLAGTIPQYIDEMIFTDDFSAKQALDEAKSVNEKGQNGTGVIANLYQQGLRKVGSKDLHSEWEVMLDEFSEPMR